MISGRSHVCPITDSLDTLPLYSMPLVAEYIVFV
jgi:hypothetical protein